LAITTDGSGRVWFVEQRSNRIGSFDPSSDIFNEYGIPTAKSLPQGIAVDASGNTWFTELTPSKLAELGQGSSSIREIAIPAGPSGVPCGPIGVTAARSGTLWLTCEFSNQIDEYFPTNRTFLEFSLPVFYSAPLQVLFDSAGNSWFTAADANMLGYMTTSDLRNGTSKGITEFAPINQTYIVRLGNPLQSSGQIVSSLSIPSQIAFSPDEKSLWITEHGGGSFDRYDIASKTLVKYYTSRPVGYDYPRSLPNGIAVDRAGNVWIAEHYGNKIAKFNPTTETMTEYPIDCCVSGIAGTLYLALDHNGTVWFSEFWGNAIAELRPVRGTTVLSVSLAPQTVSTTPSGMVDTNVTLSLTEKGQTRSARFTLSIAGVSSTGELQNATFNFDPTNLTLSPNFTGTSVITINTEGMRAGIYYLTVSARSSWDNETRSQFLKLIVRGTQETINWTVYGELALSVASVAVVGLWVGKRRKKGRAR
jgi:streptogramin lyase